MIQTALQELLKNKTVIMIAHKLSTIRNADQILVLENGTFIFSRTDSAAEKHCRGAVQKLKAYRLFL